MELLKKFRIILLVLPFLVGFRVFIDGVPWKVTNDSTTSRKLFVKFTNGSTTVTNDVDSGDSLSSEGTTVTVTQLMESIFTDFNDVNASFVTLVASTDSDYSANKDSREITVSFGGATGGNSGEAQLEFSGDKISTCKIDADEDLLDSAKDFLRIMTHELGHCMGLAHPQETVNSIMSYFADSELYRLQLDDKMAMAFLYPKDSSAAAEEVNFGMSCSRSE